MGVVVTRIWDAFYVFVFKVIRESFDALVSKWPATRKRQTVELNGVKFTSFYIYMSYT